MRITRSLLAPYIAPAVLFVCYSNLPAQMLLVNRTGGDTAIGSTESSGLFLTDAFHPGSTGETWVIDRIRIWGMPDPRAAATRFPGDLFRSITLRAGLWTDPPEPGTPDCGCHGLLSLVTVPLARGTLRTTNSNVTITATQGAWQIDFNRLSWSVPGGSRVQLGIETRGRSASNATKNYAWYMRGAPSSDPNTWHLFSPDGKPAREFVEGKGSRLDVQVWAHRMATITITHSSHNYEVRLQAQRGFEVNEVDLSTIRFGGVGVNSERMRITDGDADGLPDLVIPVSSMPFPPGSSICLNGKLRNGHPFEGCSLVPKAN